MINTPVPLVTFGIVNCNRLHYLKSCFESLVTCTDDYPAREFIVVDNASVEEGTKEYLDDLVARGVKVIRQDKRDPSNEFARGLNIIRREAKGEIVVPLQGDMEFVLERGWLWYYVSVMKEYGAKVGCITLDAQRMVTNHLQFPQMSKPFGVHYPFVSNDARPPISGAGDVVYTREVLDLIGPWSEENVAHEGGLDSETEMLQRVQKLVTEGKLQCKCLSPLLPPAVAIYTDARGTNARVRGNKRYGDYWGPKEVGRYYQARKIQDFSTQRLLQGEPLSIEEMARPLGWTKPLDVNGNWLKNPIRPETAKEGEYVVLEAEPVPDEPDYLQDWLDVASTGEDT